MLKGIHNGKCKFFGTYQEIWIDINQPNLNIKPAIHPDGKDCYMLNCQEGHFWINQRQADYLQGVKQ